MSLDGKSRDSIHKTTNFTVNYATVWIYKITDQNLAFTL